MNPDQPSRDQIETRITALLLGELPANEAELLRYTIGRDPALQKLHDQLQSTLTLVREAEKHPAEPPAEKPAPLKLSDDRRQKLLEHFKTTRPEVPQDPLFWLKRIEMPRLVSVLALIAVMALLAAMLLPVLSKTKSKSLRANTLMEARRRDLEVQLAAEDQRDTSGSTASSPAAPAALPSEPQLAPPPAPVQIVLPQTEPAPETASAAQPTTGLMSAQELAGHIIAPGTSNVYSQNVVGYSTLSSTPPPATAAEGTFALQSANSEAVRRQGEIVQPQVRAQAGTAPAQPSFGGAGGFGGAPAGGVYDNGLSADGTTKSTFADKISSDLPATATPNSAFPALAAPQRSAGGPQSALKGLAFDDSSANRTLGVPSPAPFSHAAAGEVFQPAPPAPDSALPIPNSALPTAPATELAANEPQSENSGRRYITATRERGTDSATPHTFYRNPVQSEEEKKTPILGDVHVVGNLFQSSGEVAASIPAATVNGSVPPPPLEATNSIAMNWRLGQPADLPQAVGVGGSVPAQMPRPESPQITVNLEPLMQRSQNNNVSVAPPSGPLVSFAGGGTNLHTFEEEQTLPGVAMSESKDSVENRKLIEAERQREITAYRSNAKNIGFYTPNPAGGGTNDANIPPNLATPDTDGSRLAAAFADRMVRESVQTTRAAQSESNNVEVYFKTEPKSQGQISGFSAGRSSGNQTNPEWIGMLEQPEQPKSPENHFSSRYAYIVLPSTNYLALDDSGGHAVSIGSSANSSDSEEIIPPSVVNFSAGIDVSEALDIYAKLTKRSVLRSALPQGEININSQYPRTKAEVIKELESALASNGVSLVNIGDKFVKAVPSDEASATASVANTTEYISEVIPIRYAKADDIASALNTLSNAGGRPGTPVLGQTKIITDEKSGSLLIYASRSDMDTIKGIVAKLDTQDAAGQQSDLPLRKPAPNTPVPQPEILTSSNNFSTFSMNVSDVSFKFAEASLENNKLPDTASIRSEEFVNTFDYRDPEAAPGQPMAFNSELAQYPFNQNRELLRFSVKAAASGRQAGRALNLVLLLDTSGSMERADRVEIIREALRVLSAQLQPNDIVSVVSFARTARLWADGISGDKAGETLGKVGSITPEGGTNLEEAMRLAYETARRHYLANGMNRVVLLTDGAANLGNVDPNALEQKVDAQRKQGIALDCFGIGWEDYNDDLLEELSSNGDGRYAFLNSPEDAARDFGTKLAGALQVAAQDLKVQVEFNPQRVTAYRQIGYAKHQLTKEQFRDNTVAAGEIASQEAGNALYTIEPNPNGDGPIATVHVRYRVPGTQEYREHSWDVPYTGHVSALDQSSPAMRLAATAAAFSEWLAASPYAQEVTPDDLLKYLTGVPEIYGADDRPKQLETMIREAKSLEGK